MNSRSTNFNRIISAFSAVLLMITALCLSPSESSNAVEEQDLQAFAKEIELLVNEARIENGLNPVYVSPYLCEVANIRANELIVKWDHKRPDGSKFTTAIDTDIVPYWYASENIAAGSSTPEGTFNQWKSSENHWAAILNPDITHMGVGVAYDPTSSYRWYWQQVFVQCDVELEGQFIPVRYEIVPECEGDLTGDAAVNSYDYIVLTEYLRKKIDDLPVYLNDLQIQSADCFKDGLVTESDAKVLQRYILGEYTDLPYVF